MADLAPAIQQLTADRHVVKTNIPYSEEQGDKKQAAWQQREVKSFDAAMDILRKA